MSDFLKHFYLLFNNLYGLSMCVCNSVFLWWAADIMESGSFFGYAPRINYFLPNILHVLAVFLRGMSVVSAIWGICSFLSR